MDEGTKTIGAFLRDLCAGLKKRPLDWKLIDAFTRLEEREEATIDKSNDADGRVPDRVGRHPE
jgi:hypothetical protein